MDTPVPDLLYHALQAPLFPTNDPALHLLAIRFAAPVRIFSLRITPEGVASPTGPGCTYPPRWTGKVFLNVSPSTPVNAMVEMEIDVVESQHPLDFRIDMPRDVTTRLISLLTPAETLSVSIYGYGPSSDPSPAKTKAQSIVQAVEKEDWSWVSEWAGGLSGLLDLIGDASTYSEVRDRTISSLELLQTTLPGGVLSQLVDHPPALAQLFTNYPTHRLCRALLDSKDHILHLNLKPHLPPDHPLCELSRASPEEKRRAAWTAIEEGRPALMILSRTGGETDLLAVSRGEMTSNLSRLMACAESWAEKDDEESRKCLELALDIIASAPQDPIATRQLALRLTRLVLISRVRGSSRKINLPISCAGDIARTLLPSATEIIHGKSAGPTVLELLQPYLHSLNPSHPIYRAFTGAAQTPSLSPFPDTIDGRALSRLHNALTTSTTPPSAPPSSLVHAISTADLLSIVAPSLLRTLASAPIPPLDIPSSIPDFTPDSQASAWAGKVYSEHEFRTRENVGLGIAGMSASGSYRASRPASRHVDEYAR